MSVTEIGIIEVQNKSKIIQVYAIITETSISGIVFAHEDHTNTYFTGPPEATKSADVNPLVLINMDCRHPDMTQAQTEACINLKFTDFNMIYMPFGFDQLKWGYVGQPNTQGYAMTDMSFYKNKELLGTIINKSLQEGPNRKDLTLPEGYVVNGMRTHVYHLHNYYPYNYIEAIYGMADPEARPIAGGWSEWGEWGECSTSCGPGIIQRTRTCSNPYPIRGGATCSGDPTDVATCNLGECPINGEWSEWGDWGECIKNADGQLEQSQQRMCNNPAPQFGGTQCAGASTQFRKCIQSNPEQKPPVTPELTISKDGATRAAPAPTLNQPSVTISTSTDSNNYAAAIYFLIAMIIIACFGGYFIYKKPESKPESKSESKSETTGGCDTYNTESASEYITTQ